MKGRQDKDRVFCSRMAEKFNALVWDVDYSLAPENPFPKAVDEAYQVVKYAFEHSKELEAAIAILEYYGMEGKTMDVAKKAGETREFQPKGLIAEFFPTDLYTDPVLKTRIEGDMPAETARIYNAFYCEGEAAKNPYVSPLFAEEEQLRGFPETLIMSAGLDSLCFEDEEFAMKLSRAGVPVTCKRFTKSHHGFTINRTDEWEESLSLIEKFMERLV